METKNKKLHTKIVKPTAFAAIGATMIATGVANTETITHIFSGDDDLDIVKAKETIDVKYKYDVSPYIIWNIDNAVPGRGPTDAYFPSGKWDMINVDGKASNDNKRVRFESTHPIANQNGDIIWCIQSGVLVDDSATNVKGTNKTNDVNFNSMGVVAYYGYYNKYGKKAPDFNKMTKEQVKDFVYTVRMIQELGEPNTVGKEKIVGVGGYGGGIHTPGSGVDVITGFNPSEYGISVKGYYDFKNKMNNEIKKYKEGPKLENVDKIKPGSTVKVKDKNGALDRYDITGTPKGVKAKIVDKNTLEITADRSAENGNIEFTYKIPKEYNEVPFFYKFKDKQNLTNARVGKKTQTKLNVGVEEITEKDTVKTDQHGNPVAGAVFKVTNHEDGTTTEVKTDKSGVIKVEGYEGDKITIEEIQPPIGYIFSPDHIKFDITLDKNGWSKFNPYNPKSEYLGTKARNDENDSQQFVPEEKVNLKDTIEYANLDTNQEYTAVGWLMDKSTGEPLLDKDGNKVEVSKQLKPEKKDGTFEVDFEFNASDLRGKELVAFEELYIDSTLVAEHKDINDKEQTVRFTDPKIGTTAKSKEDGGDYIDPVEDVGIVDTVEYDDLTVGDNHRLSGVLMDKETGEPVIVDGKEVRASKEFKTEQAKGSIDVDFFFDANELKGKDLVVFEKLERQNSKTGEWYEIAKHEDIEDEGQTVKVTDPKIGTTALNVGAFDEKKSDPNEDTKITDVVEYKDLLPGKKYKVQGVLMNKETGEKLIVNGKTVDGKEEFTTEKSEDGSLVSGKVDVVFDLDATELRGFDTVVFEDLHREKPTINPELEDKEDSKWVFITDHKDIEDEGQTVHINDPRISLDKEVSKEVYQRGDILTYTFTVTNPGDVVMKNIKFTDEMFKDFKIPFDELEPGQTETFTIDYTASKKDVHKNYLYNEADITGETPDGWEEKDKDNVVSMSDKEIRIVKTPKDCNTCNFPNVVVDIKNKNTLNGVIDNEGKFISKDKLSKEEVKEAEKVIEETPKEELEKGKVVVEKEQPKEQPKKEQPKEEVKVAEKEQPKKKQPKKEKEKEKTPELAETGIHNPGNQALIVSLALALLGGAGFLFARSRKNKNEQ